MQDGEGTKCEGRGGGRILTQGKEGERRLNKVVREGLTQKMTFKQISRRRTEPLHDSLGKGVLGRGSRQCKGPEVLDKNKETFRF